ncbi:3'-5' exonuclease [Candidatus Peregrinibacteria bacterium]|nr:3'-5' exonuclease [Candidatus Peregrinibacteria bacterium]MBT7484346.1 3'-5' exonuclease [Candidatus Peregrinibacteria bacterium]
MKVIIFDTETTGLPNGGNDLDLQPYVCQFAAITYEYDGASWQEVEVLDLLVRPEIPIPLMATTIHGITDEMVMDKPAFTEIASQIVEAFQKADVAVAHNLSFDQKILEIELMRASLSKQFLPSQTFDTMTETKELCQLPGRHSNFKAPRLMELHQFLFSEKFDRAHNALNDVKATARCLQELAVRSVFIAEEPSQGALF